MVQLALSKLRGQVEQMAALPAGWDGYDAPPPNAQSRARAVGVIESLVKLGSLPLRAVPLPDGGVALLQSVASVYAAIEIYNDGEVIAAFSNRGDRKKAWKMTDDKAAIEATVEEFHRLSSDVPARQPGCDILMTQ